MASQSSKRRSGLFRSMRRRNHGAHDDRRGWGRARQRSILRFVSRKADKDGEHLLPHLPSLYHAASSSQCYPASRLSGICWQQSRRNRQWRPEHVGENVGEGFESPYKRYVIRLISLMVLFKPCHHAVSKQRYFLFGLGFMPTLGGGCVIFRRRGKLARIECSNGVVAVLAVTVTHSVAPV